MNVVLIELDLLRLIPLLIVFGYAAWQDHKIGEVSNWVWMYVVIGFALTVYELTIIPEALLRASISAGVAVGFGLLMFYLFGDKGKWGGADTKAIITLALSYPLTPAWLGQVTFFPFIAMWFAAMILLVSFFRRRKTHYRYLPYLFCGIVLAAVI